MKLHSSNLKCLLHLTGSGPAHIVQPRLERDEKCDVYDNLHRATKEKQKLKMKCDVYDNPCNDQGEKTQSLDNCQVVSI